MKGLVVITNRKEQLKSKKFAVLAKQGDKVRLVRFGDPNMTIKKIFQLVENLSELDTSAIPLKINYQLGIGLVKNGSKKKTKMGFRHSIVFVF